MKLRTALLALALAAAPLIGAVVVAPTAAAATPVTIAAAGDIACTGCRQAATAGVIGTLTPKYVLPLGDLSYPQSSLANLNAVYAPSWGRFKAITKPTPGNHETTQAGYFAYFGAAAHPDTGGYYSFSTGAWHVVVLNTGSCTDAGVCGSFTEQVAWLKADLAAHPNRCTLAVAHNPPWSYGVAATPGVQPLINVLQAGHVDLLLAGHAHRYERWAPRTGLTEIVAGTGGAPLSGVGAATTGRVAAFADYGVVKLDLAAGGWTSAFRSITGAVRDTATGTCH